MLVVAEIYRYLPFHEIVPANVIGTDGSMYWSAKTYIKNVCDRVEKLFDVTLKSYGSPLEDNYHPEIDESPLLSDDMVRKY